jgi:hypothetical protein
VWSCLFSNDQQSLLNLELYLDFSESIEGGNSTHEALGNPLVSNAAKPAKDVFGANRKPAGIKGMLSLTQAFRLCWTLLYLGFCVEN